MTSEDESQLLIQPNLVEAVGFYGGDETHAMSAWTSTYRDITDKKRARMQALLSMLADAGHGTPFEKSGLHFLVTTDIATHIHLIKHRIGVSVNAESARYKELKDDKLYVPPDWTDAERDRYLEHMELTYSLYHTQLNESIARGLPKKRAKETARFYLPYGNQLTADIMFNWRSFDHFLKLRYSSHAQGEVREVATKMLEEAVASERFTMTLHAFGYTDEGGNLREPFD